MARPTTGMARPATGMARPATGMARAAAGLAGPAPGGVAGPAARGMAGTPPWMAGPTGTRELPRLGDSVHGAVLLAARDRVDRVFHQGVRAVGSGPVRRGPG